MFYTDQMRFTHNHTADLFYLSHQIPGGKMFNKLTVAQLVKNPAAFLKA
jgi:hypothetical protein